VSLRAEDTLLVVAADASPLETVLVEAPRASFDQSVRLLLGLGADTDYAKAPQGAHVDRFGSSRAISSALAFDAVSMVTRTDMIPLPL
jgi:hypothetical protein